MIARNINYLVVGTAMAIVLLCLIFASDRAESEVVQCPSYYVTSVVPKEHTNWSVTKCAKIKSDPLFQRRLFTSNPWCSPFTPVPHQELDAIVIEVMQ